MEFCSRYVAHKPDHQGFVQYSEEENAVWRILFERQMQLIPGRADEAFIKGLAALELKADAIPQLPDLSKKLKSLTNWEVAPVAAIIPAREFFELLAHRKFPAATFIRYRDELDYVTEPDIFHEVFGHCPLLTDPVYAHFLEDYAKKVLTFPESDWPLLQRLFWFTVEFGLIKSKDGLRIYGGGILSSIQETVYSVESDIPLRILFDPVVALRMPYRIDKPQATYFVIENYETLYNCILLDLEKLLARARELKELPPLFDVEPGNPNIHILMC